MKNTENINDSFSIDTNINDKTLIGLFITLAGFTFPFMIATFTDNYPNVILIIGILIFITGFIITIKSLMEFRHLKS